MSKQPTRIFYPLAVGLLLAAGLFFDVLFVRNIFRLEPYLGIERTLFHLFDESLIFQLAWLAGLLVLSLIIYVSGLDPFRPSRPRILVFLNFLPLSIFTACVVLSFFLSIGDAPRVGMSVLGGSIALGIPLLVLLCEIMAARILLSMGKFFDDQNWPRAAFFCLMNSLRWHPGVPETVRRSGLLLMDLTRLDHARNLLERLEPIQTTEDMEVLRALERIYNIAGEGRLMLQTLERQQELKPGKAIDQKLLDQSLALEDWPRAIALLESGRYQMTPERVYTLNQLYVRIGDIPNALLCVDKIKQLESAPYDRVIAMLDDMAQRVPENMLLAIYFGLVLLETDRDDLTQRGAGYLERVLEHDPERADLRMRLADYYQKTLQHQKAASHYQRLIDQKHPDPETYLGYSEVLKADGHRQEASEVYRLMRGVCPEDWRGFFRDAELQFQLGALDEAEPLLKQAQEIAPESAKPSTNVLMNKLQLRRKEIELLSLSRDIASAGAAGSEDLERRFTYIEHLLALDRGDQAVTVADQLLEIRPDLLDEIQKLLENGISLVSNSYRIRDYLADLYFRQERYAEALEVFRQMAANSMHPEKVIEEGSQKILARAEYVPARIELAENYMRTSNWEGVLSVYEPLMKNPPEESALKIKRQWVEAAYNAGRIKEAIAVGSGILSKLQDNIDFLIMCIHMLEDDGNYQAAFGMYRMAIQKFPQNRELLNMRKTVADNKMRDRMEALQALDDQQKMTSIEHYEKADLHRQYGQSHRAIIHYQIAAEDPALADLATTKLAICLCDRRLFDLADETLNPIELNKEKVQLHPELKKMFYHIADTMEYEVYKQAALKYFKRIFRVDAAFKDVVKRLERLDGS